MTGADAVAADAAYDAAVLRERLASLEEDAAVYRFLAVTALDALHSLTLRYERTRADRDRLREDAKRWREEQLIAAGVEDVDDGAAL